MKKKIVIILVAIIILAIVLAGLFVGNMGKALNPDNEQTVSVAIPSGSGTGQIAQILVDEGIIDNVNKFKLWSRIKGKDGQYKAGTYALSPAMTFEAIADVIISGKVKTTSFTIPEGYTIYQTADALEAKGLIDKEKFIELLENGNFDEKYVFLQDAQKNKNHLEGYLFPNTYSIDEGMSEERIIRVMLDEFTKKGYDTYTTSSSIPSHEYGSLNDVIIIASIIERECAVDEERPLVSSVIYNRLKKGMSLQMCSTVQYVLGKQKEVLTNADTRIESPYNTYINQGLPPGPICSPGLASIKAALNPADTDYIYFVLSEKLDGTTNFSSNYNDFLKDKSAYDKAYTAAH